ncbi:Gfo/Idh/MocA family oxidoreductase [Salipiger manganoxidans]|uniref:Gfo/Idh/MocA family protein n=1 Tax=Salipiger marinus TaxID=555512 RepID=UPI001E5DCE6B|nr:Gfo/Idh/MocA family oxidoreductase [Salipiger manganoxidans]MCD1617876.1 Gfo/Idh/MocA family oxidoreductase [Salipiger manganoxidans]
MSGIGVGVIGCGVISDIYLKNAALFPQIKMRAVADLRAEVAEEKARTYGVEALTVEALLAREDIGIVLNLTIPAAHAEIGHRALAAGKHVYSEKPLADSFDEARALNDAAQAAGLRLGCAPDTFLGGAHQTARALVDAGEIGRPVAGTATLMLPGHERWHPNPDFYYSEPGGGPMMDMGPYYITAMLNLLGPVARVTAFGGRSRDSREIATGPRAGQSVPVEVDTHLAGVMEFAQGALVQIATSFDVRAHRHGPLELYGTTGSMTLPDPNRFDGTVELHRDGAWQPQEMRHGHGDGNYRGLGLAQMAGAIASGGPHCASGDLALHALEVMEAMHRSAREGRAIEMTTRCERPAPLLAERGTGEIALQEEVA